MKYTLITVLLVAALASCKKPENRRCFKSTGSDTELEIPVEDFDKLYLGSHVAYVLIQDSLDKVVLKGGKNLLNQIDISVNNKLLSIENTNRCAFLRNAKRELVAEIHCTSVINIHYEGTEYLKTEGTLESNYLALMIRDGAGPVDLTIKSIYIDMDISHGWGDYTLHGTTNSARIGAHSNGYCDAYDLTITDSVYVASDTPGNVKLRADGIPLAGFIKGSGNIWYKGIPESIGVVRTGEGKVENKN